MNRKRKHRTSVFVFQTKVDIISGEGRKPAIVQWKKDYKIAIQRRLRQICQIHFT